MGNVSGGDEFRAAVIARTRRRIEIYRDAGETWRFAQSLKSVSEDTAQEYEGRTILELVQNGHDALGSLSPGRIAVLAVQQEGSRVLYVANEGAGFAAENFRAITELALSSKAAGEGIGNKGLGFRSVLQLTDWPEIYSKAAPESPGFDGYCFRFARPEDVRSLVDDPVLATRVIEDISPLALPVPADTTDPVLGELAEEGYSTVVRLPLRDQRAWELAVAQAEELVDGEAPLLLFLDRVAELLVEVRSGSDAGSRHVLVRSERASDLVAAGATDWVREVDLAGAGRYLLARRTLEPDALGDAVRRSVQAREIDAAWENWDAEAWVAVALRLDEPLGQGRLYTFLPMAAGVRAPFCGHAHAPFFTKLARLAISENVALNAFLLDQMAVLTVELSRRIRSKAPHPLAADLVLDLMCWEAPARLDAALNGRLATEPIVPLHGREAWGSLQTAYGWPDGKRSWRVLTTDALTRAGADLLAPSVGPERHTRVDRLCRAVLSRPFRPPAQLAAGWAETVAQALLGPEHTAGPAWGDFYSDVSHAFARDHGVLRGRRIILDQDMRLRAALGGRTESGKPDATVFFHPDPDTPEGDSVTRVPGDLRALRRRISFTHPAIAWDSAGRGFLERNELVRPYQLDRVFDALSDLLSARPAEALSRDALTFAFRQYPALTQSQRRRLARIPFRVPLAGDGWARAARCSFSPAWGTEGARRLERFLAEGGDRIPALAAQRDQWISGPGEWPAPVRDRAAYAEFLEALGVCDGLRPGHVGDRLGARHGNELRPSSLAIRFGLQDELAAAWAADIRSGWTRFAHPCTPYEFEHPLAHLAGASEVAGLNPVARREFAELLLHGLRSWGEDVLTVTVHRPTYTFKDAHVWPTPLASFLRNLAWLPVAEGDGLSFVEPCRAWFSTDGELPPFVAALPLSTRRMLADGTVVERLVRLGLRRWDDPRHAGAAVKQLGGVLDKGDVPEYLSVSFKRHYERAWTDIARTGQWPWVAGEEIRLVVSRTHVLGTFTPTAGDLPVSVCDEADPLKEALIELAGHPVLVAPAECGDAVVRLAEANGLKVERTSVTHVQVRHRDGDPITPTGQAAALVAGREWLVTVVALALELKSGAFVRRSERGVRTALERLRALRVVHADDVQIAISGTPTEPPSTTRALPLPDEEHPTVVVWRSDEGWDELQAATPAVAQLLGRPWLQDALELILVKLERSLGEHSPEHIQDSVLAAAMDTTGAKVTEIRRNLTGDVQDTVRLLRPALACLAGDDWNEQTARVLARAAGERELAEIIDRLIPGLPLPSADLVELARSCATPAELRDELRLDFEKFNDALASLGPGYSPEYYPERHEQVFGDFVRAHSEVLLDRLRERYAAAALRGEDISGYAAARGFHGLQPDPDWLPRFIVPPEEAMRCRVREWLRGHGADDDLELPTGLEPVERLRARNTAALEALVPTLGTLVAAWCRRYGIPVPAGWHGAVLLQCKSLIDGSGLSDLLPLSEEKLVDAVARAVGWPAGMPHAADPAALGLTAKDLAHTLAPPRGSGGPAAVAPRTITIGDAEVRVGRDQFSAIADIASRTIDESFLAQSGRVRLDTVAGVPQPRRGGTSPTKPRVVVARTTQPDEDQRSAVGLVGEVAARAWLQRHYTDVKWTSGYAAVINDDPEASDSLGYDFEVAWRDTTRLYEVKALSGPCADRVEFELGPSEVDAARRHARGNRYRVLLITSALAPEDRRVFDLPNPFSVQGRDRFRIVSRGLRYQCSPLGRQ
ncbi:hypothetical protein [Streptomyces sp. NPDC001851]|uniref:sacsin N-terminal ATP-binding-like domain-containing protein n=1 Tax=Streptomyces sp. NPDC001851 TaxID=3154529 RepID=UPI0033323DE2